MLVIQIYYNDMLYEYCICYKWYNHVDFTTLLITFLSLTVITM